MSAFRSLAASGSSRVASASGRDRGAPGRSGGLITELALDGMATVRVTGVELAPLVMVVGERV